MTASACQETEIFPSHVLISFLSGSIIMGEVSGSYILIIRFRRLRGQLCDNLQSPQTEPYSIRSRIDSVFHGETACRSSKTNHKNSEQRCRRALPLRHRPLRYRRHCRRTHDSRLVLFVRWNSTLH